MNFQMMLRNNPYRLFFPLAIFSGLIGVGHWALWTMGFSIPDVKNMHLVLQSQGFLAFVAIGFLFTAFPRFSGTQPPSLAELLVGLVAALVFLVAVSCRYWLVAHIASLVSILLLPFFALRRIKRRTKDIPASFVLLAAGLIHFMTGVVLSLWTDMGSHHETLYLAGPDDFFKLRPKNDFRKFVKQSVGI